MREEDGPVIRILEYVLLGNRDCPPIEFEDDGGTPEERDRFLRELERNHPNVERIYRGRHGCGMPVPASLLKDY